MRGVREPDEVNVDSNELLEFEAANGVSPCPVRLPRGDPSLGSCEKVR